MPSKAYAQRTVCICSPRDDYQKFIADILDNYQQQYLKLINWVEEQHCEYMLARSPHMQDFNRKTQWYSMIRIIQHAQVEKSWHSSYINKCQPICQPITSVVTSMTSLYNWYVLDWFSLEWKLLEFRDPIFIILQNTCVLT